MTAPQITKFIALANLGMVLLTATAHSQSLYTFGNPSPEEQMYIEYINRARANPPAEGVRLEETTDGDVVSACNYFSVDKAMMLTEFNAIPVAPPLAPHASLTSSRPQALAVDARHRHSGPR